MRALLSLAILGFSCVNAVFAQGPASTSPVVADILKLSHAKMDEAVIMSYVQSAPRGKVSAADLLELHSNGISSRVLIALLNTHTPATAAPTAGRTENSSPVPDQADPSANATPEVVTAPLEYVSPVYVGGGSIYYHDTSWWGIGWDWDYLGWSSYYPWYGYGWYPYYVYWGNFAHCGYYHHGHHGHHGHGGHDGHHGHHGHGGLVAERPPNGGDGRSSITGRSTVARAGGNLNSGRTASPVNRSVSGVATTTPSAGGNRAGTTTGNRSSRSTAALPGAGGATASRGVTTVPRSSTSSANPRATTAGVGQNGAARPAVTPSSGANRPAFAGSGQPSSTMAGRTYASPSRSVPSSTARSVTPGYAGRPSMPSGYQGGGQQAPGRSAGAGVGGGYAPGRSFSAPSSMGNYSAGRSYSGGSSMGRSSGASVSRGFSGGGGGFRGGGGGGGGRR